MIRVRKEEIWLAAAAHSAVPLTLACRCFKAAGERFAARAAGFT